MGAVGAKTAFKAIFLSLLNIKLQIVAKIVSSAHLDQKIRKVTPTHGVLFFYQNHVWNNVTSTVRASRVTGGCGAIVKPLVR